MPVMNSAWQTKFTSTILSGQTDSDVIDFKDFAQGGFILPAAFTGATVSFKVCNTSGGTFVALYDAANVLVSLTVTAARAYAFPVALFPFAFVKIVSASAEGADRLLDVALKY